LENNLKIVECNSIRTTQLDKVDTCFDFSKRIEDREVAMERIIGERLFAVWRRIYHRSLIEDRFFIPYKIHQDVFYTIDTINMVERIGYLDSPLYIYNMGNNDSIIRGKYTQNKLNARDAAMYVIEKTRHSNETIRKNSKKYLVQFLTFHYNNLFLNKELDKDGNIRREIRETIRTEAPKISMYGTLIEVLPFWCYSLFLHLNIFRIEAQIKLIKLVRNVQG